MDEQTMKLGLLMECAHAHQELVDASLGRLTAHSRDLDGLVRDQIRRTLTDELQAVNCESNRAVQTLKALQRAATMRMGMGSIILATICTAIPATIASWMLPTGREMSALRAEHDALVSSIARLEQRGGRVDLRRCGDALRVCVRIDRHARAYGEQADYFIVKGY